MLTFFTLCAATNALGLASSLPAGGAGSAAGVATLTRRVLLLAFYCLLAGLYLIRSQTRATTESLVAKMAAVVGTFSPFALAVVNRPSERVSTLVVANAVSAVGIGWSVWSLRHLGRSISIVPEARRLVRSGPYRIVRHPLYLGELVAAFGLVASGFTPAALAVWVGMVAVQLFRAQREEELLATAFPEYDEYQAGTARVLPGIY
jgi:protein-S-isoprenylcysteine O-methyltransferase Ste14